MRLRRIVAAVTATACTFVVVPLATGSAGADEAARGTPSADPVVAEAVDAAAQALVVDIKAYNEAGFLEKPAEPPRRPLKGVVSEAAADEALEAELSKAEEMAEDMDENPVASLHVDKVTVERAGEPEIEGLPDGTVRATIDLEITRHLAEDGVDWIEVVPHEMTIDPTTGEVLDVVVKDLEYELEHPTPEPEPVPQLMHATEEGDAAPAGLSSVNKKRAVTYALRFGKFPNKNFKYYKNDCTNFVSQAMLAGGWREVIHNWPDYKASNAWWYGGIPTASWTWASAEHFYRMTRTLKRTTILRSVYSLLPGDILQYKKIGSKSMTHTMIVTRNFLGMPYLTYHTKNTIDRPFGAMIKMPVTWYAHHT